MTMVRYSRLERSRRGKMSYCNICTPVHRVAVPKALGLLYPKFWVQTLGMAALWTGVSVFCNLHTAFPLNFPVCVPRPRSVFDCHRSRFRSCCLLPWIGPSSPMSFLPLGSCNCTKHLCNKFLTLAKVTLAW